jgi:hypothetical protein
MAEDFENTELSTSDESSTDTEVEFESSDLSTHDETDWMTKTSLRRS